VIEVAGFTRLSLARPWSRRAAALYRILDGLQAAG
jgi:hypothetical protein